jgi:hypothetical protein
MGWARRPSRRPVHIPVTVAHRSLAVSRCSYFSTELGGTCRIEEHEPDQASAGTCSYGKSASGNTVWAELAV